VLQWPLARGIGFRAQRIRKRLTRGWGGGWGVGGMVAGPD